MIIALNGVDKIVSFASPVLDILYPVIIVIILLNLLGNIIKNNSIVSITVYVTLLFSIISTIHSINPNIYFTKTIFNFIPLSSLGFIWVIPALIAFVISYFTLNNKVYKNTDFNKELFEEPGI